MSCGCQQSQQNKIVQNQEQTITQGKSNMKTTKLLLLSTNELIQYIENNKSTQINTGPYPEVRSYFESSQESDSNINTLATDSSIIETFVIVTAGALFALYASKKWLKW